jgi:hypothetical protein
MRLELAGGASTSGMIATAIATILQGDTDMTAPTIDEKALAIAAGRLAGLVSIEGRSVTLTQKQAVDVAKRAITTYLSTLVAEPAETDECRVCRGYCIDNQGRDCLACNGTGGVARPTQASDNQAEAVRALERINARLCDARELPSYALGASLEWAIDEARRALAAMGSTKL